MSFEYLVREVNEKLSLRRKGNPKEFAVCVIRSLLTSGRAPLFFEREFNPYRTHNFLGKLYNFARSLFPVVSIEKDENGLDFISHLSFYSSRSDFSDQVDFLNNSLENFNYEGSKVSNLKVFNFSQIQNIKFL